MSDGGPSGRETEFSVRMEVYYESPIGMEEGSCAIRIMLAKGIVSMLDLVIVNASGDDTEDACYSSLPDGTWKKVSDKDGWEKEFEEKLEAAGLTDEMLEFWNPFWIMTDDKKQVNWEQF